MRPQNQTNTNPKQSPIDANSKTRSFSVDDKIECPIDDPNLGIITEMDHQLGKCLCQFCTCGQHECAKKQKEFRSPRHNFVSMYSKTYRKGSMDKPLRYHPKEYQPNTQKMDLITTKMLDYRPHVIEVNRVRPEPQSPVKWPFTARSLYKADFPNWGPILTAKNEHLKHPMHSHNIKFTANSSYRESFYSHNQEKFKLLNRPPTRSLSNSFNSTVPLGVKDFFTATTTNMQEHRDFSENQLNSRVKRRNEIKASAYVPPNHFSTTMGSTHTLLQQSYRDPRMVRRALISYGRGQVKQFKV